MISPDSKPHYLAPYSEIRGITTSITDEDPVKISIESRRSYHLEIPKKEIYLIIQDPEIDQQDFTLDKLHGREISVFRTENDYRLLVKGGEN